MIWKVKPQKQGPPYKKNIIWEIHNNAPDKYCNIYHSREKIYILVSDSENSKWEFTIDIVEKVIAPAIEAKYTSCQSARLCDNFKGNRKKEANENILNKYPTTDFFIMAGGITPKAQPLKKIINKIWKFFCVMNIMDLSLLLLQMKRRDNHCLKIDNYWLSGYLQLGIKSQKIVKRSWIMCG